MVKNSIFFQLFGPPCRIALADLDDSVSECGQFCALDIEPHLATLRKIELVAVRSTNETTPHFWDFNSPSPRPPGADGPQRGRGTSADIVRTQVKFGVDPSTRSWDIAQKPPKCKNSPLTPIVTKISFPPFSAPQGPLIPKRGKTHSEPDYARMQNLAWIGPRVVEKSLTEQKKTKTKNIYSTTNISLFALTSEWRVKNRKQLRIN